MYIKTLKNSFEKPFQENDEIKGKIIRNSGIARSILQKGKKDVWLFDIKPDRENPMRTVYLFEDTDKFQEILDNVLKEHSQKKQQKQKDENAELRREIEEMKRRFEELTKATESVNNTEAG